MVEHVAGAFAGRQIAYRQTMTANAPYTRAMKSLAGSAPPKRLSWVDHVGDAEFKENGPPSPHAKAEGRPIAN
jgi:hypothetical protein